MKVFLKSSFIGAEVSGDGLLCLHGCPHKLEHAGWCRLFQVTLFKMKRPLRCKEDEEP